MICWELPFRDLTDQGSSLILDFRNIVYNEIWVLCLWTLGSVRTSCMTVLFLFDVLVFANFDKIYVRVLCSRVTCMTSTYSNYFILAWTSSTYSCKCFSITWNSPRTWEATSWELVQIFIILASMSLAILRPAKKALYSTVLLVIAKDKPNNTSITIPSSFSMMTHVPLPFELEDLSTKIIHVASLFLSKGKSCFSHEVGKTLEPWELF